MVCDEVMNSDVDDVVMNSDDGVSEQIIDDSPK
jgi:hypothetical protein